MAIDPASLIQGRSRETTIRRDAGGNWSFDGDPLTHPNLVRAFDAWVGRAPDGRYCLKNDINWAYITLEGAPFFVRSLEVEPSGVTLALSNGARVPLAAHSLRQDAADVLYCDVEVEGETMVARFDRHVAGRLLELVGEDAAGVYLEIGGERIRPPVVSDPLVPLGGSLPSGTPSGTKESSS